MKNIMSEISKRILETTNYELFLLKEIVKKDKEVEYDSKKISIYPNEKLKNIVNEKVQKFLLNYTNFKIIEYDGTAKLETIYKISADNNLLAMEKDKVFNAINGKQNDDADVKVFNDAYIIRGNIKDEDENNEILLITVSHPLKILKNKFFYGKNGFEELNAEILCLSKNIDIIIYKNEIYFLSLNGEKLFNMERAYKKESESKVDAIKRSDIINGWDLFSEYAVKGFNPKRLCSFHKEYLSILTNDIEKRKLIAEKFKIDIDDSNKFLITKNNIVFVDDIIKLLCGKGKINPFTDLAEEVSDSTKWRANE